MFDLKTVDRLLQKHMDEDYNASYSTMVRTIKMQKNTTQLALKAEKQFSMLNCMKLSKNDKNARRNECIVVYVYFHIPRSNG